MSTSSSPETEAAGAWVCWFAEGLSSQRDVVLAAKRDNPDARFIVSHRDPRPEILTTGDLALREPRTENGNDAERDAARLDFLRTTVARHGVKLLHVGRNGRWHEAHRRDIESLGVQLTTGGTALQSFDVADDKGLFSEVMSAAGLPAVPSMRIDSAEAFEKALQNPSVDGPLCVKPVHGIYGAGFWRLDPEADLGQLIRSTEARKIAPDLYLEALRQSRAPSVVLMPWLEGEEYSVDMLVEEGHCLCAVQRCKQGLYQQLEREGEAASLAVQCVRVLQADGLVNVQARRDASGKLFLLEANLRPSGGIGYTLCAGINLPGLFVQRKRGTLSVPEVRTIMERDFRPATVKTLTQAIPVQANTE